MDDEPKTKPLVSFLSVISLGNLLIVVGMVATALLGIFTIGGEVQRVQDAITHEAELRVESERSLNDKLANSAQQEQRDVQGIGTSLTDLKSDLRALVQASTPPEHRR